MDIEKPYDAILDAEKATEIAATTLQQPLDVLRDMTNYGTQILVRSQKLPGPTLGDIVVLNHFFGHGLTMLDAAHELLSRGCAPAADLQVRSLVEARLSIAFLIMSDTEERAKYFDVWRWRKRKRDERSMIPGTEEYELQRKEVGPEFAKTVQPFTKDAKRNAVKIDKWLAKPEQVPIVSAYEKSEKKRCFHWAGPFGVRTVKQLSIVTGHYTEYVNLYGPFSDTMHGTLDRVERGGGYAVTQPLRQPEELEHLVDAAYTVALGMLQDVVETYREGELAAFQKKVDVWKKARSQRRPLKLDIEHVGPS